MTIRCFLATFAALFASHCLAATDTVVPLPKEIRELGEPIPLDGFRIVSAGDERSQIGATEINERITSPGGKPLPIVRLGDKLPNGRTIVIAPCTASELGTRLPSFEVTPSNPGVQGYVVQTDRSGDNHDGIRIERSPDCRIHHNVIHGVKGNSPNSAGVKLYSKGVQNVIVEDNFIHDNTAGVFDKDFGVDNTFRRNYFTRNHTDFYGNTPPAYEFGEYTPNRQESELPWKKEAQR